MKMKKLFKGFHYQNWEDNSKNCQKFIFGLQCVAINIEKWLNFVFHNWFIFG